MGYRLSKIYTRTGDDGTTNLNGQNRLLKNHPRIETIGTVDELNSAIGIVLAQSPRLNEIDTCLTTIQHDLFNLGGELSQPSFQILQESIVQNLEETIDKWNESLPPLKEFILPGGIPKSAFCHLARTICRRAERNLLSLNQVDPVRPILIQYLNRLSDLLFVAARKITQNSEDKEILWKNS